MPFLSHIYFVFHRFGYDVHHLKRTFPQKILLRLFFLNRDVHTGPLFKNLNILKFSDKVALESCLLIRKSLHKTLLEILFDWFTQSFEFRTYNNWWANQGCFTVPFHCAKTYGRYSSSINVIYIKINTKVLYCIFKNQATERFNY